MEKEWKKRLSALGPSVADGLPDPELPGMASGKGRAWESLRSRSEYMYE